MRLFAITILLLSCSSGQPTDWTQSDASVQVDSPEDGAQDTPQSERAYSCQPQRDNSLCQWNYRIVDPYGIFDQYSGDCPDPGSGCIYIVYTKLGSFPERDIWCCPTYTSAPPIVY